MKRTARVISAPARLGKTLGVPTLYRLRTDGDAGGAERCEVIEADPDGGDVLWPETFPGLHAAVGGVQQLARAASTQTPWSADKTLFHEKSRNDGQKIP